MEDQSKRNEHIDSMIAVFNEKLEHINNTLTNILTKLDKNDDELKGYIVEITNLKNKDNEQQRQIDEIKKVSEDNKKWWLGILSAVSVAFVIYVLNKIGIQV